MHLYLRLLLDAPETYTVAEQAELRECLTATPGIAGVTGLERHPKGGYTAQVENTGELGRIIEHLAAHGYRAVL